MIETLDLGTWRRWRARRWSGALKPTNPESAGSALSVPEGRATRTHPVGSTTGSRCGCAAAAAAHTARPASSSCSWLYARRRRRRRRQVTRRTPPQPSSRSYLRATSPTPSSASALTGLGIFGIFVPLRPERAAHKHAREQLRVYMRASAWWCAMQCACGCRGGEGGAHRSTAAGAPPPRRPMD